MRWNVTRPSLTAATMPARPGSVSTMPAADLATSVAVETAIPDLRLAQRRRVVGAVAAHADGVAALLKRLDELVFVLRKNAGEDREMLRGVRCPGLVRADRRRHRAPPHAPRWPPSPARRP